MSERFLQAADAPKRVLLRYHGGKARLAKWIVSLLPPHEYYVEAFGGGASVLLAKRREDSLRETYNDKAHDVVNLFEVLSDDRLAPALLHRLQLTPYARESWERAYRDLEHLDVLERARTLCVRVMMGWGAKGLNPMAAEVFRANDGKSNGYANDWTNYVQGIPAIIERLRGVHIENRDALELIHRTDSPQTLFYLDPPYLLPHADKTFGVHAMSHDEHEALLLALQHVEGKVLLSGYANELYQRHLQGWWLFKQDVGTDTRPGTKATRTDCLWMNEAAASGVGGFGGPLSAGGTRLPIKRNGRVRLAPKKPQRWQVERKKRKGNRPLVGH